MLEITIGHPRRSVPTCPKVTFDGVVLSHIYSNTAMCLKPIFTIVSIEQVPVCNIKYEEPICFRAALVVRLWVQSLNNVIFVLLFSLNLFWFTFVSECKYNQTYRFLFSIVFHASYIAVLISKVSNRTLTAHFGLSPLASFFDCVRL